MKVINRTPKPVYRYEGTHLIKVLENNSALVDKTLSTW